MEIKTPPYGIAELLETPEEMAANLEAWIQQAQGDAACMAKALEDMARAKGIIQIECE
ncbi:MAG: DNA-binding protein [Cyanobium sp.]